MRKKVSRGQKRGSLKKGNCASNESDTSYAEEPWEWLWGAMQDGARLKITAGRGKKYKEREKESIAPYNVKLTMTSHYRREKSEEDFSGASDGPQVIPRESEGDNYRKGKRPGEKKKRGTGPPHAGLGSAFCESSTSKG